LVLFNAKQPNPICCWKLKKKPVAMSFLSRAALATHNSPTTSVLLYVNRKQEIFLLEEFQFPQDELTEDEASMVKNLSDKSPTLQPSTQVTRNNCCILLNTFYRLQNN
jgi:hypothetical protein